MQERRYDTAYSTCHLSLNVKSPRSKLTWKGSKHTTYVYPLLIIYISLIMWLTTFFLGWISCTCPFRKVERLPGIGPQIQISKLTWKGYKLTKYGHPLLIVDTCITMWLTTLFQGWIPFTCLLSKVERLPGIVPQIQISKLIWKGSKLPKYVHPLLIIDTYITMWLTTLFRGWTPCMCPFSNIKLLPLPHPLRCAPARTHGQIQAPREPPN
jgi:hypothetical protein